jgi:ATP-dependent RNA helicase RhlE
MSGKKTEQIIYEVYNHEKLELLQHLITHDPALGSAMIYLCRKDEVHSLTTALSQAGFHVDSIHGKKKPEARNLALKEHIAGKLDYLVATEACARNMDISGVKTIINVDFPELIKDYEHQVLSPSTERVFSFANPTKSGGNKLLKSLEELIEVSFPRATAEGFSYAKHALKVSTRNKQRKSGPRSKPLQNKKSKLKKKGR